MCCNRTTLSSPPREGKGNDDGGASKGKGTAIVSNIPAQVIKSMAAGCAAAHDSFKLPKL